MNIEELLPDGQWMSEEEYVVRCPFLDHPTHNHCYINVAKGVFFCHYADCGEKGTIKKLLKKYEIAGELEPRKEIIEKKEYELTDFSQFSKVMGKNGTLDLLALTYLRKRGLSEKEIEFYDIRVSDSGKYYGRVLVPIYENDRLVCFATRSFMPFIKPKYLYPRTGETLLTSGEAIFGYEKAWKDTICNIASIVITEGVFDAIAANRIAGLRGLAILSSHLTEGQLCKLLRLSKKFTYFVALDSDAHKDAVKIARQLTDLGRRVKLVLLEKGDPASVSSEELAKALDAAELFSFEKELSIVTPVFKTLVAKKLR